MGFDPPRSASPDSEHEKIFKALELMRTSDVREPPAEIKARLARVHERLRLVEDQSSTLVKEKMPRLKEENARMAQVARLLRPSGIGPVSSWTLAMEFFAGASFGTGGKQPPYTPRARLPASLHRKPQTH
jgi:hypothetical protein